MQSVKKSIKTKRVINIEPKIIIDPSLNELKNIEIKSGKLDEINTMNFKLSF